MVVVTSARGAGISQALSALEDRASALGATEIVWEPGVRQAEAMALYRSAGYKRIEAFGEM
jgi:putative acetyltransferase